MPRFINIEAAKVAKANNVTVIFDLGGRDDKITNETISLCDIISPNETELERLLSTLPQQDEPDKQSNGSAQESSEEVKSENSEPKAIDEAKIKLFLSYQKPGFKLLLKQGAQGSSLLWIEGSGDEIVLHKETVPVVSFREHPDVKLVDTTGAGDTYTAAFAVKYAQLLNQ